MIDIEISDEELEGVGKSRWLKKQKKQFYQFWGAAVITFVLISIIVYKLPYLADWAIIGISIVFTLTFWTIYERILGKPSRLAGIEFRKGYRLQQC